MIARAEPPIQKRNPPSAGRTLDPGGGKTGVRNPLPVCARVAALPLVRTMMQGGGGNHIAFVRRLYRDAAYVLAAGIGIIVFEAALGISLENYWFEELGQSHRYWLSLEYRVAIFCGSALGRPVRRRQPARTVLAVCSDSDKRAVDRRICVRGFDWIFCDAALDSAHAVPRRHGGRRSRSGVRQRSFFLLAGIATLRRRRRNRHRGSLPCDSALAGLGLVARSGTAAFVYRLAPGRTPDHYGSVVLLSPGPSWAVGRAGYGRAWFSAHCCASHSG